ncbi:zincin [Marasmius fiardii PR-910]|nr:zincin [Marasmius fiardii PR-910]
MLAASFVALALASFALAGPMKRSGSLIVSLSSPSTVEHVDQLKFTATVKNTGTETVKVLKYNSIMDDKLPTRSFTVTKNGVVVPFIGIKPSVSLEHTDDSAYAVIPAGESVTVYHDVASLFDFASFGAGTFRFDPVTTFQLAGSEDRVASFADTVEELEIEASPVEVTLTGQPEKRELVPLEKRARDICTSKQASFIASAYNEGQQMANAAVNYVSTNGPDSLYTSYFKNTPTSRVQSVLSKVADENDPNRTLDCQDPYDSCQPGVIAYTAISTRNRNVVSSNVYFCPIFFEEVEQSRLCDGGTTVADRNIRGATVLHELTHATSGTEDVAYGCSSDQRRLSASQSAENADNYNCFASQVWQDTQCSGV